jgi:hypothetical protein
MYLEGVIETLAPHLLLFHSNHEVSGLLLLEVPP